MKKIIVSVMAMSFLTAYSASAQNIGQLSNERQPQNLKSAEEFVKFANTAVVTPSATAHTAVKTETNLSTGRKYNHDHGDCDDGFDDFGLFGGLGLWGLGGWGLWPYFGSFFPGYTLYGAYGGLGGFGGYGGFGGIFLSQDSDSPNTAQHANAQAPKIDRGHTPVVCFSNDSAGNWYANVDIATNAVNTQKASDEECSEDGMNCNQSLGCVIAGDNSNSVR